MIAWPAHRGTRGCLAYVPSGARCFQNLTVDENLDIASHASGGDRSWTKKRIWELFPKLEPLKNNLAGALSGGERQMLAVRRSPLTNPPLILPAQPPNTLAPALLPPTP